MNTRKSKSRAKTSERRIAVVTGSRAEYGLLRSTMVALRTHSNVTLQVVVTGSHLLPHFGHTIDDIVADGWNIAGKVRMQSGSDSALDQAKALSRGVSGIAKFLVKNGTDIVVVLGDRIEAMAGALAAITTGRALAHIHGGDLAQGDFDDSFRHAITKLAHIHFPATADAARRIIRMGESSTRVYRVGAPGLDRIKELLKEKKRKTTGTYTPELQSRTAMIVQHPCGRDAHIEREVMGNILKSVWLEGMDALCLYPNTDRGHQGIIEAINNHAAQVSGKFRVAPSLPRDEFLLAMRDADLLVGNSSSGIIESASVGIPAIDIGPRQTGRQRCGPGVIHCGESLSDIRSAVQKSLQRKVPVSRTNVYGDGRTGERIARKLSTIPITRDLTSKLNSY